MLGEGHTRGCRTEPKNTDRVVQVGRDWRTWPEADVTIATVSAGSPQMRHGRAGVCVCVWPGQVSALSMIRAARGDGLRLLVYLYLMCSFLTYFTSNDIVRNAEPQGGAWCGGVWGGGGSRSTT